MTKFVKISITSLLTIIFTILIIVEFLPSTVHIEEHIRIQTDSETIINYISKIDQWEEWCTFPENKNCNISDFPDTLFGTDSCVQFQWEEKEISGKFILIQENNQILVKWSIDIINFKYPFEKIHGVFLDEKISNIVEKNLENLKSLCESKKEYQYFIYNNCKKRIE
ncbi:MAG: hypothetical protein ABIJ97_09230 [Bacteroidota bacterium]